MRACVRKYLKERTFLHTPRIKNKLLSHRGMNNWMVLNYGSVKKKKKERNDSMDNHKSGPERETAGGHEEGRVSAPLPRMPRVSPPSW